MKKIIDILKSFNKKNSLKKGLTSKTFPMVGMVDRRTQGSIFDNATRVPSHNPFNTQELNPNIVYEQDTYKSCSVHGSMYKSNRIGGCPRCEINKSTMCKSCGSNMVKTLAKGLHCPKCQ